MIGISLIVAKYISLSARITDNLCPDLYGNIPDWRFMASNDKICLHLSRVARLNI